MIMMIDPALDLLAEVLQSIHERTGTGLGALEIGQRLGLPTRFFLILEKELVQLILHSLVSLDFVPSQLWFQMVSTWRFPFCQ